MANIDNTGFRPATSLIPVRRFPVTAAGNATYNLFVGDAVKPESTGGVCPLDAGATGNDLALGVIVALYDSSGIPVGAPGSSESHKYLTLATAGYADVALAFSDSVFIGQSQTGTSYGVADTFASPNIVAGTGDTTTARSGHELGATGGVDTLILGKVDEPGNSWGVNVDVYFVFLGSFLAQIPPAAGV